MQLKCLKHLENKLKRQALTIILSSFSSPSLPLVRFSPPFRSSVSYLLPPLESELYRDHRLKPQKAFHKPCKLSFFLTYLLLNQNRFQASNIKSQICNYRDDRI